jgi:hypothetical protein
MPPEASISFRVLQDFRTNDRFLFYLSIFSSFPDYNSTGEYRTLGPLRNVKCKISSTRCGLVKNVETRRSYDHICPDFRVL